MPNRRQFLSECSTLTFALAAAFSPGALSAASLLSGQADEQLSFASFSKCLGSTFVVRRGTEPDVALELFRAHQLPTLPLAKANALDASHEKFSLMFRGPQSAALAQNTYTFEHRQMGRFEMFIVPAGMLDEEHGYYQAVFNRRPASSGRRPEPA
jgi:hypothetical protein